MLGHQRQPTGHAITLIAGAAAFAQRVISEGEVGFVAIGNQLLLPVPVIILLILDYLALFLTDFLLRPTNSVVYITQLLQHLMLLVHVSSDPGVVHPRGR